MKLTGIVIAKNEEKMIADCLDCLRFCDEIILIDNKSTDRTAEIAKRFGAKIFELETRDFFKLRNLGLEKSTNEWILYVDADERVTAQLADEIEEKIKESEFGAYKVFRKNFYLGDNQWPKIEEMPRLFRKDSLEGWQGKIHESPILDGKIGKLNNYLLHFTHRDLTSMLNKTIEWSDIEAKMRMDINHPKMTWWRFPRVMIPVFFDYYIRQKGYKLGTVGLIESIYQSFSTFVTYAKLWELQEKK